MDGGALCGLLDDGSRRAVERLGGQITGVRAVRDCPGVLVAARWRVRPFAGVAPGGAVDLERVTVDGDTATVRPVGSGAPLSLLRVDDEWRADLTAEPRWSYRLERARACTAAGRRFARQPLPTGAKAVGPYLRGQVAILRRFEQDVAGRRAPVELRARDARMQRTLRSTRVRTASAARRLRDGELSATKALEAVRRSGWDPAAQLPGAVSRGIYPITEGCLNASTPAANPAATKRVLRRCTVAGRRLLELDDVDSIPTYERAIGRVASALQELGRAIGRATPPAPIVGVHEQTVTRTRRFGRELRGLVALAEAGNLQGILALEDRLLLEGSVIDHGLAQLGYLCELPEARPKAPSTPA